MHTFSESRMSVEALETKLNDFLNHRFLTYFRTVDYCLLIYRQFFCKLNNFWDLVSGWDSGRTFFSHWCALIFLWRLLTYEGGTLGIWQLCAAPLTTPSINAINDALSRTLSRPLAVSTVSNIRNRCAGLFRQYSGNFRHILGQSHVNEQSGTISGKMVSQHNFLQKKMSWHK